MMSSLQIWDLVSDKVFQRHTHSLYWMIDCAFSPDQTQIVTLSDSIKVVSSVCVCVQLVQLVLFCDGAVYVVFTSYNVFPSPVVEHRW